MTQQVQPPAPAPARIRCGIDLGTTYSAISWYDEYNRRIVTVDLVTIADGNREVRSVIYFPGPGQEPVVGEVAWNARQMFPERVVVGIKREMGSKDFVFGPVDGTSYSPRELSSVILKALVKEARTFLGDEVLDVVITVPAYFEDNERTATEEAGKLAGLNVLALLSEPQAAALAYCIDKNVDIVGKYVLVYDLGGGTFDVTLVFATTTQGAGNVIDLDMRTLFKQGSVSLGGLDWDRGLAEIVAEKVRADQPNIDLLGNPGTEADLLDKSERAKRALSHSSAHTVVITDPAHPKPFQVQVTRAEFEAHTAHLLDRTRGMIEEAFAAAAAGLTDQTGQQHKVARDQIDVLLTGGSSKMPMVRQMLEQLASRPPLQYGNPNLLVTMGAAYWAHIVRGGVVTAPGPGHQQIRTKLEDKTSFSVGVEVWANGKLRNSVLVPLDATIGKDYERQFRKMEDGLEEIAIVLYECDKDQGAEDPANCRELGVAYITNLPASSKKGESVMVKLRFDSNLIIRGEAVDMTTGNKVDISIDRGARPDAS